VIDLSRVLFERAETTLKGARAIVVIDPDGAAARAYYCAFHAVSALFARDGRTFVKHKAVETAVHRDLVLTGLWPRERGADYSFLHRLRDAGDYGGEVHVSEKSAGEAVAAAERILEAVRAGFAAIG
jgi:uncharacterized protein (UPF0332 family)